MNKHTIFTVITGVRGGGGARTNTLVVRTHSITRTCLIAVGLIMIIRNFAVFVIYLFVIVEKIQQYAKIEIKTKLSVAYKT